MINDSTQKPKAYELLLYFLYFPFYLWTIGFSYLCSGLGQSTFQESIRSVSWEACGFADWLPFWCTWAIICCRWCRNFWGIKICLCPLLQFLSIFIKWRQTTAQTDRKAYSQVCGDLKVLADSWVRSGSPPVATWFQTPQRQQRPSPKPPAQPFLQWRKASQLPLQFTRAGKSYACM